MCGKIDCFYPARVSNGDIARYSFAGLYKALKYFETNGICQEIARYSSSGSGTNYPNNASPFGIRSWCVFKFPSTANRDFSFYIHAHVGPYPAFGDTNHSGLCDGGNNSYEMFGIQLARGIGSENTIWNGTTNANGSDTKGSNPYWKVPDGGTRTVVLPRNNETDGSYATNKNNFSSVINTDASIQQRMHFLTDGDAVVIFYSNSIDITNYSFMYMGLVDPLSGRDKTITMIRTNCSFGNGTDITENSGGIDYSSQGRNASIQRSLIATPANFYPDTTTGKYIINKIPVYSRETGANGIIGTLRMVGDTWNVTSHVVNSDYSLAFFNSTGSGQHSISVPWDGVTVPGTNNSLDGVEFYIP